MRIVPAVCFVAAVSAACTKTPRTNPPSSGGDARPSAPTNVVAKEDAMPDAPKETSAPLPTKIQLKSASDPTAVVGEITITLLHTREKSVKGPSGKLEFSWEAAVRVDHGTESREVHLAGKPMAVYGYQLRLLSAGDGQATPQSPRESIAEIEVDKEP